VTDTSVIGVDAGYAGDDSAYDEPEHNGYRVKSDSDGTDYTAILEAPDYATLIKIPKTAVAREYEKRVNSMLKAGVFGLINSGNFQDAAALLHYGPGFSAASGDLASANDTAKHVLDLATSPNSPVLVFAATVLPLIAQLLRNHETQLQEVPSSWRENRASRKRARAARKANPEPPAEPKFYIHLPMGRRIGVRFNLKVPVITNILKGFQAQTHDPAALTYRVFSDDKLNAALSKQGIKIRVERA
jgi:hypothetical protein